VGTAQALAVVPGVSRSAAVIIAGRSLGLPRATIVEFSFLLAIPTMLAASAYDLYKSGLAFSGADWKMLAVGFVFSFAVALASVGWLLRYIKKHSFSAFGWYRIALGVIVLLFFI
jgi:undecaprenyl-diphosphatase